MVRREGYKELARGSSEHKVIGVRLIASRPPCKTQFLFVGALSASAGACGPRRGPAPRKPAQKGQGIKGTNYSEELTCACVTA